MTSLRRALIALAAAGVAAGFVAVALVVTGTHNEDHTLTLIFGLLIGWSFIGTGLFAWWRRPENHFGALMTAVGFTWFAGSLSNSSIPGVYITGVLFGALPVAILIHMLLAFPAGRLEGRLPRALTAIGYFLTTVMQLASVLVLDDADRDFPHAVENPLLLIHNKTVADIVLVSHAIGSAIGLLWVTGFLWRRWWKAPAPLRRVLGPIYVFGALNLVMLAMTLMADVTGFDDSVELVVDVISLATLALVPYGFLAGLLRTRITRGGAVSQLMTQVGEGGARSRMRDLLADALGDPSLELAYWLPDRGVYVSEDGRTVEVPDRGSRERGVTLVEREGRRVAAILYDPVLDEQRDLVRGAGGAVALALENERLDAELRARIEELRASRARLVEAGMSERRRIERDLHDGAQQRLVSLRLALGMARSASDPAMAQRLVEGALGELDAALAELRELARGIHPGVLTDHGLEPALSALADRAPLPVSVVAEDTRLPPAVESAVYFMVAEALTNVAKYAKAESAAVRVVRSNGHAVIEVSDDGVGGADPVRGSGLRGLEDRVAALDGRLSVSSPSGSGTVVRAEIPCE